MTAGGFLSEFFTPVSFVAFLVTFGRYFTSHWFALFMPSVIGCELLLFIFTGGVKIGEKASMPKVTVANPELAAARQRNAEEDQMDKQLDDLKKTTSPKHEKANAKKAEKAAAAAAAKKNK